MLSTRNIVRSSFFAYLDDWALWAEYGWDDDDSEFDFETNKEELTKKLVRLKELIAEKEEHFGENHGFL